MCSVWLMKTNLSGKYVLSWNKRIYITPEKFKRKRLTAVDFEFLLIRIISQT